MGSDQAVHGTGQLERNDGPAHQIGRPRKLGRLTTWYLLKRAAVVGARVGLVLLANHLGNGNSQTGTALTRIPSSRDSNSSAASDDPQPVATIPASAIVDPKPQTIAMIRGAVGASAIVHVNCHASVGDQIRCVGAIDDTLTGAHAPFSAVGSYDAATGETSLDPTTPVGE